MSLNSSFPLGENTTEGNSSLHHMLSTVKKVNHNNNTNNNAGAATTSPLSSSNSEKSTKKSLEEEEEPRSATRTEDSASTRVPTAEAAEDSFITTPVAVTSEWRGESAKEARFRGRYMPEDFHRLLYAATSGNEDNHDPSGCANSNNNNSTTSTNIFTRNFRFKDEDSLSRRRKRNMEKHQDDEEGEEEESLPAPPLSPSSSLPFITNSSDAPCEEEENEVRRRSNAAKTGRVMVGRCGGYEQPDEARDVEDLVKGHTDYQDLPEERRQALREAVIDLHKRAVELQKRENSPSSQSSSGSSTSLQQQLEHARVRASRLKGFKDTARKSELTAAYQELVREGMLPSSSLLSSLLIRKQIKSHSGVLVITVLMGPGKFSCPKDCYYCPQQPGVARSYLLKEPAVLRGYRNGWDPVAQFYDRASALEGNGHVVDKVELIILGGTFSFYPAEYAEQFIGACFYAANTFYPDLHSNRNDDGSSTTAATSTSSLRRPMRDIQTEITLNETARCRIIGLTLETRPDYISARELRRFRRLGVTRVQLGIQHLDDAILTLINRECPTAKAAEGIEQLLNAGFKVDAHWMPDLPGSSFQKDLEMFQLLLDDELNERFQVDQWKVYPTATVPYTKIQEWYLGGKYKPYAEEEGGRYMVELLLYIMTHAPYRLRLNRIVRDIPSNYIKGGERRVNLRQVIEAELKNRAKEAAVRRGATTRSSTSTTKEEVEEQEEVAERKEEENYSSHKKEKEKSNIHEEKEEEVKGVAELRCRDIRERECKKSFFREEDLTLFIDHHRASGGSEYYISMENKDRTQLYGHLRLRIRDDVHEEDQKCLFPVLQHAALIRELHTYGSLVAVHDGEKNENNASSPRLEGSPSDVRMEEEEGERGKCSRSNNYSTSRVPPPVEAAQHRGIGTRLMQEAEKLSLTKYGLKKYVVIAGVGARKYYEKLGYHLEDTYMVKYVDEVKKDVEDAKKEDEKTEHSSTPTATTHTNTMEDDHDAVHHAVVALTSSFPISLLTSWNTLSTSVSSLTRKVGDKLKSFLSGRKRDRSEE